MLSNMYSGAPLKLLGAHSVHHGHETCKKSFYVLQLIPALVGHKKRMKCITVTQGISAVVEMLLFSTLPHLLAKPLISFEREK